jgi:hypothetical protein
MTRDAKKQIKELCVGELKIDEFNDNTVYIFVPYDQAVKDVYIEGDTTEEQVNSFIIGINQVLEDMIDHIGDCKL